MNPDVVQTALQSGAWFGSDSGAAIPAIDLHSHQFPVWARRDNDPQTARGDGAPFEGPESSTADQKRIKSLFEHLDSTFERGRDMRFEDGMESEFSRELVRLVELHGIVALAIIGRLIADQRSGGEVAGEALRWLGRMEQSQFHWARMRLFEESLCSPSPAVRDGAILALASLNDPHAIPYIRGAVQQETIRELREDMEQVLAQLQDAESCLSC